MKHNFIFLFLLVFSNSYTQTIEKFYDFEWKPCEVNNARFYATITKTDSGYVRKDFFINEKKMHIVGKYNDVETKVENGYFKYFYSNGILKSNGYFKDGKKNGLWLDYHYNGMIKDSSVYKNNNKIGTYLSRHPNGYLADSCIINNDGSGVDISWFNNGLLSYVGLYSSGRKQNGKWKYYHNNGEISSIEIFKEGILLNKTYLDEEGIELGDTINKNRIATFKNGEKDWKKYLSNKLFFPRNYKLINADQAVVVLTFTVNEEGSVSDAFVSTPFHPEFDKIALDVITSSPKWRPAINNNRRVKEILEQIVYFQQIEE